MERDYPVDFRHRIERLPDERKAAERALVPYRQVLENLEPVLNMPRWQVTIPEGYPRISLRKAKRLGYALALSGKLDPSNGDLARARSLGRKLLKSEAGIEGWISGTQVELATGDFSRDAFNGREEAVNTELSRLVLPKLGAVGPWDPLPWRWTGAWEDRRRVALWLLSGHTNAYDPQATVDLFVSLHETLVGADPTTIRTKAIEIARPWPEAMRPMGQWSNRVIPYAEVQRAKAGIQAMPNAYGALLVARTMMWVAGSVDWIEALKPRSADGDVPPRPAEAS